MGQSSSVRTRSLPFALLGVNIDHVATLRQLRGTPYPDILEAAKLVETAGGDQITVHLREDRRHIQPEDVKLLRKHLNIPLNLEMSIASPGVQFACRIRPDWACLVPEKRKEVTTEGGLDVKKNRTQIKPVIQKLKKARIQVSCFIEPDEQAVTLSHQLGANAVEFHTGRYCLATQGKLGSRSKSLAKAEFNRILQAAQLAQSLGLRVHAGHGFDYLNIRKIAELENPDRSPLIQEFNIGHAIVCRAVSVGLGQAVREMVSAIRAP